MSEPFGQVRSDAPLNDAFSGYDAVGGLSFSTAATIPLTAEHTPSSATYQLSAGEVTIKQAGTFECTFGASALAGSTTRTQAQAWLEVNGVEIPGTRVALYCRITAMGATGSAQIFYPLSVNDVIRIRVMRTGGGAVSTLANGSRLALRRL